MARSNFKVAAETKSAKKADCWLNLTYVNAATGKRSSLGGIPLTSAESGFHKNLVEKLQCMDPEEQASFIAKVLTHVSIAVTFPDSAEGEVDYGLDDL